MTTAKLVNQHDYITLRIKFDGGKTLNLTRSRNGTKVSGSEATRELLAFFDAWIGQQKQRTIGEAMQHLRGVAERCATTQSFIAGA